MSREVCGICWCPYDEDTGACACAPQSPPQRKPLSEEEKRALADKFLSCQPESYEVSGVFDLISAVERAHGVGGEG